jgi:hypothetical protein
MGKKAVNVFCIMFQNINNLPTSASFNKSQQVIDCIIKQELDVFLMTEIGLCWPKLSAYDQWNKRTIGRLSHHKFVFSHNKTEMDQTQPIQHGGVGICTTNEGVHRVIGMGQDTSGLGRWA